VKAKISDSPTRSGDTRQQCPCPWDYLTDPSASAPCEGCRLAAVRRRGRHRLDEPKPPRLTEECLPTDAADSLVGLAVDDGVILLDPPVGVAALDARLVTRPPQQERRRALGRGGCRRSLAGSAVVGVHLVNPICGSRLAVRPIFDPTDHNAAQLAESEVGQRAAEVPILPAPPHAA